MKNIIPITPALLLSIAIFTVPFRTEASAFQNGHFSDALTGWTVVQNGGGDGVGNFGAFNFYAFNGGQAYGNGVVSQTFDTYPGATYTISFKFGSLGGPASGYTQRIQVEVRNGTSAINGDELIVSNSAAAGPEIKSGFTLSQSNSVITVTDTDASDASAFSTITFVFVATGNSSTVVFSDRTGGDGQFTDGWFTDVQVQAPSIVFLHQPQNQLSYYGHTVNFSVTATNLSGLDEYFIYQWLKNSTAIPDATNSILTLTNVQAADEGAYAVIVSNLSGLSVTSAPPAILTVNPFGVSLALYAGLTIDGNVGQIYGIQATTNLADTNSWAGITNVTLSLPTQIWYDSQPANQTQRYYRILPGPISIP